MQKENVKVLIFVDNMHLRNLKSGLMYYYKFYDPFADRYIDVGKLIIKFNIIELTEEGKLRVLYNYNFHEKYHFLSDNILSENILKDSEPLFKDILKKEIFKILINNRII